MSGCQCGRFFIKLVNFIKTELEGSLGRGGRHLTCLTTLGFSLLSQGSASSEKLYPTMDGLLMSRSFFSVFARRPISIEKQANP